MSLFLANCGIVQPSGGGSYTFNDADAEAFSNAAGLSSSTHKSAIDDLVVDLKAASLWVKLEVIYPFVGGSASTHKFNLKDPQDTDGAFRGTMNGTITHNSNGVTGNGTDGYIDTHYNQSVDGAEDNEHVSVYSRTDGAADTIEIGCVNSSSFGTRMFLRANTVNFAVRSQTAFQVSATNDGTALGYFSLNRTTSAGYRARHNASNTDVTRTSDIAPQNGSFVVLAQNRVGSTVSGFSARNLAWAALGQGLTEAEDSSLKDIVVAYQTALSRNA